MESTRSTRDRFGWVPFPDLLLNVTVFGPMTSPCWNNWCSKARSDISQVIPNYPTSLSQKCCPHQIVAANVQVDIWPGRHFKHCLALHKGSSRNMWTNVAKDDTAVWKIVFDQASFSTLLMTKLKLWCVAIKINRYLRSYTPQFAQAIARLATAGLQAWAWCKWRSNMFPRIMYTFVLYMFIYVYSLYIYIYMYIYIYIYTCNYCIYII